VSGRVLTGRERELVRIAIDARRREQLEHARTLLQVSPERHCSRCDTAVELDDLSPGRYWCRACESKRKRDQYHRAKRGEA
jgi:predicted nucleic acid-binding Zn ribbon protein